MVNLSSALSQLRLERSRAEQQLTKLTDAISVLESLNGSRALTPSRSGKRIISAASRRKMAIAQRARWAKLRSGSGSASEVQKTPQRRVMSIAGRGRIAAAQRARWAKQKAA
jgi:hypothetical protein